MLIQLAEDKVPTEDTYEATLKIVAKTVGDNTITKDVKLNYVYLASEDTEIIGFDNLEDITITYAKNNKGFATA